MPVDKLVEEYKKNHPKCGELHERAMKTFVANGATARTRALPPYRPYITHAQDSRKWDVDGNEYIDYVMGHGALILGHSHPEIVRAVQEQVTKGVHYGDNHELEVEWAELIQSMFTSAEKVEFFACGQEANIMAIRLARIFTNRRKILRFEENFHGWADEVALPGALGVVADEVEVIPGHDLSRVEEELATKEYAMLMIEGGGARMGGQIPWDADFIRALPSLTQKYGVVCLIDEVITGFRDSPGGWQATIGVKPDLTTLGKAVGGGLGAGALVGRVDILDILRPKSPPQQFLAHSGTWNANPLAAVTGVVACKLYKGGEVQERVNQLGAYLRKKGNHALKEHGISASLYGRSIVHLYLGPIDFEPSDDTMPPSRNVGKIMAGFSTKQRLCLHLLHRGIATMEGGLFVLSMSHTTSDIDEAVDALVDSLEAMIAEGSVKQTTSIIK